MIVRGNIDTCATIKERGNLNFQRKYRKTLETLVYLAIKDHRNYWILKAIYFADKEHLKRYGRQIFDDNYRAMKQGPVPSLAYDVVKCARGDGYFAFNNPDPRTALEVPDNRTINALRAPEMGLLSQTDIECLDYAHNMIRDLSFGQLKALSHDAAYNAVDQDEDMTVESIIETLDNGDEVMEYRNSD